MEFEGIVNARDLGGIRIGNRTMPPPPEEPVVP